MLKAGVEPTKNLISDFLELRCAVMITTSMSEFTRILQKIMKHEHIGQIIAMLNIKPFANTKNNLK